ncbi:MAG: hypothetical protein HRU19_24010 [Pseudobacteriovorax sp.]|nr:hypothetical protein [Pseudobacteriovorax sp.]
MFSNRVLSFLLATLIGDLFAWQREAYAVDDGNVVVELSPAGAKQIKVLVKNKSPQAIGFIKFTLAGEDEKGEITFEDIPVNNSKSQIIKVNSFKNVTVRDVVVVDGDANTRSPSVQVLLR